jgi:hypothetical protein
MVVGFRFCTSGYVCWKGCVTVEEVRMTNDEDFIL